MRRWQGVALAVAAAVIALVGNVWFTHDFLTSRFPGGNDSIPRYLGARAWLTDRLNPYSEEVARRGQLMIYGRLARDDNADRAHGEDKAYFVYPLYVIFFYLPLGGLDWPWARAVLMVALEVALAGTVLVSVRWLRWRLPPWALAVLVIWALVDYHGARTLILAQWAGMAALFLVLGLWALAMGHDGWAGVLLALATTKPQMALPLLPLVGLWSLAARRWRLAGSLAASMAVLTGASFAIAPTWVGDMLGQLAFYDRYTEAWSPVFIVTRLWLPVSGVVGQWAITLALSGWLAWEWWAARDDTGERRTWVWMLTLVLTNVIAWRTATTNYVMMFPVVVYLLAQWGRHLPPTRQGPVAVGAALALTVGMWALFAITVRGRLEQPEIYMPLPVVLLAGLVAERVVAWSAVSGSAFRVQGG